MKKVKLFEQFINELEEVQERKLLDKLPIIGDYRKKVRKAKQIKDAEEREKLVNFVKNVIIPDWKKTSKKLAKSINNDSKLSDEGKQSKIDHINFVVYDGLDTNTTGGVEPPKSLIDPKTGLLSDKWWNSINPEDRLLDPLTYHDMMEYLLRSL